MKRRFILVHKQAREGAQEAIRTAPDGFVCEIKPATRNGSQNALLHAVLTDISKQAVWFNQKFDVDVWKRLCVAAWLRERNEKPMMVPSLDGHGIDIIYERTSTLSKKDCAELIEWCYAFGSQQGVRFSAK